MYWKDDENRTRLPLTKGRKITPDCLFEKEKKITIKITEGLPSLSLTKRNVKSVIQSPEKSLFLP